MWHNGWVQEEKVPKKRSVLRTLGLGLAAGVIFLSGWGIGSGRIALNRGQLFREKANQSVPTDLSYASVEEVYDTLRREYDGELDNQKLLDGLKAGLAAATGDPYTEYLNKEAAREFDEQLNGTFSGIGAELGKDDKDNLIIVAPIAGFPAEKAGLKAKDVIAEVDGNSTFGLSISEAVNKIRGPINTKVKLRVIRNNAEDLNFEITREQITIPSVESKILEGNIGYVKISRFSEDTLSLASKAAQEFKNANVKGVILDLRNNPGGLLDASVGISSIWLDAGKPILQEKRGEVVIKSFVAKGTPILKNVPTVVLINEGSASASEIVAGALRDNKAATLIGIKTFGKGSVQQLERLDDGGVLKVTIAKWFTPAGVNINKEGIKPDKEVKLTDEDSKAQRDPQLDAAKASLQ